MYALGYFQRYTKTHQNGNTNLSMSSQQPPPTPPDEENTSAIGNTNKIIHKTLPISRAGGTSDCIITTGTRRHVNGSYFYSQLPFLPARPNQKKSSPPPPPTTLLSLLLKQVPMLSNY